MIPGFLVTPVTIFSAIYFSYAVITNNSNAAIMIVATFIAGALMIKGFSTNPHKRRLELIRYQYRNRLHDNIALACALYYKVHPDYRDFVKRDIELINELMEQEGFKKDSDYIDSLYYEYYMSDLSHSARQLEAMYEQKYPI